ncbi:putative nitrilase [Cylindrobasidium torrendii FP15055 ss-10]|uniref:Putative nitrilase n=1 Tax=Cylindrobasidium torrendii FP15055 ss-10 TaxID=1314674 RepID=A0A0D7BNA1_9AGAR|nr:putative nitrilase [Cylindrobasidium torrendii FP15055 ss-10]
MPCHLPQVRVAACNVAPIYLDTAKTVQKAVSLIAEAAGNRADLVVFPETFIPAYPIWSALASPIDNHDLFCKLAEESIFIDGPEMAILREACRKNKIFAHVGINERSRASLGCIWNASVLIGDTGDILIHHRKLVPTYYEKLTWAPGDGAGLVVCETERLGRIGGLICGENGNSLARFSLMAQGEQLHISQWPPLFPTRRPGESGNFDLIAATRIRVQAHCFEGKCFGIVCSGFMDAAMRDFLVERDPSCATILDNSPLAGSFFIDPTGLQIGDEVIAKEGIAYCDMDLRKCIEPKQFHDFVGGYQRFDVFKIEVNRDRVEPVTFTSRKPTTGRGFQEL